MDADEDFLTLPPPSLRRTDSQVSLKCKICNGQKNLKWRCMDCKITICSNCKDRHASSPSSVSHMIVLFSDIEVCNVDLRSVDLLKKSQCPKHPNQTYKSFCKTCNFLICSQCMDGHSHFRHKLLSIEQFVEEKFSHNPAKIGERRTLNDSGYADLETDCIEMESFDKVNNDDDVFYPSRAVFHLIHTMVTGLPTINFMSQVSPDTMWIGGLNGNTIRKINIKKPFFNRKSSTSRSIDQIEGFEPLDLAVSSRGELLFICRFDKSVKLVRTNSSGDKQICDICNFSPLEPVCIHSRQNDRSIWVGLTEGGHDFEIPENGTRQVVEITQRGQPLNVFEFTCDNKRLFTLPLGITTTMIGICVIDRLEQDKGRVVALDKSGQIIWIYTEKHPSQSQQPFLPSDIVTTGSGNIIVADCLNNTLHVLNTEGELLTKPFLVNLDIEMTLSLTIDQNMNRLWIGSDSDINSRSKRAKIYEIEFFGI